MKKYFTTLLLLIPTLNGFSQKENNIWYFGRNAGVDFNSGAPVSLTNGALNTAEGAATICDKNGNLLFYTDGQTVYTRNHTAMTNGTGLLGHSSATQSAIIVPNPGNANRYYVFTVGSHDQYSGNPNPPIVLAWSEVDMTLNGGLGGVVAATKNTQLEVGSTEKIAAIRHANKLFFWVIGQRRDDGNYRAFLVDCNGVNPAVISNVGHGAIVSGLGYLKVSHDGRKLANAIWVGGNYICDFDRATGIVSNRVDLGHPPGHMVCAFPPTTICFMALRCRMVLSTNGTCRQVPAPPLQHPAPLSGQPWARGTTGAGPYRTARMKNCT
jgi:hypothetical protein